MGEKEKKGYISEVDEEYPVSRENENQEGGKTSTKS